MQNASLCVNLNSLFMTLEQVKVRIKVTFTHAALTIKVLA